MRMEDLSLSDPAIRGGHETVNETVDEPVVAQEITGLPVADGMCLSYWLQGVRNNALLNHRTKADLPRTAEIVIIGSGMSGTLSALSLLESPHPPRSVVVLEAREFCSGATGRNAGHCRPDQFRGFPKFAKLHGPEQAIKILDNERETWEKLVAYVKKEQVDCDLWIGHSYDVSMSADIAEKTAAVFQSLVDAGGKTDHITRYTTPEKAARVARVKSAHAVYSWEGSTLYPWKLTAHLMRKALDLGVNLQTWTPVTSISETQGDQWTVTTERGSITAQKVLLATNAWTGALLDATRGAIRPIPHMCNKVIPPTISSGSKALQNTYSIVYDDGFFSVNPRSSSDGVVLVGGSNPNYKQFVEYIAEDPKRRYDDTLTDYEPVTEAVVEMTQNEFGWSKQGSPGIQARYDYAWSGIIGRSADEVPFIGAVPGRKGLWICAGHNGHGMARIFTCAPGIAKLMQGSSWADTGLPECFEITQERLDRVTKADVQVFPGKWAAEREAK